MIFHMIYIAHLNKFDNLFFAVVVEKTFRCGRLDGSFGVAVLAHGSTSNPSKHLPREI